MLIDNLKKFIKINFLPYKPDVLGKEIWDNQFQAGEWAYLGDLTQAVRYSFIIGIYDYFFDRNGKILDLGCGQGLLLQRLKNHEFLSYVGVDISQNAINLALRNNDNRSKFICESINVYKPEEQFDLIVFNESLYYIDKPLEILAKYAGYLTQNGKIIISMWDYKENNNKLWPLIDKKFEVLNEVHIKDLKMNSGWIIKTIRK